MSWDNMYKNIRSKKPLVWPEIQMIRLANKVSIDQKSVILDLGCGEGRNMRYFLENNFNIIGVDQNEEALKILKNLYSVEDNKLICSSGEEALKSFSNDYFDLIVCWGLVQYIEEPNLILQEISRVLKKDSHLIISFTAETDRRERADVVKNLYNENKIKELVKKCNLKIKNFGKTDNIFITDDKVDSFYWVLLQK
ncbi:class I SAM-dependent methyltransferase [Aliarcobacter cryaerophilus]|uniref:class I SAM-dependent methyltransferase n=1 Tax=Aliarcobacter cryaerophilus TaxID=28198 RepID=UPI003DA3D602